jgi:hypothetical protein
MADITKFTVKNMESIKAPLNPPAEESRQNEPTAVPKAKKTRPKKRNAEAAPRKSGLKYLGTDKKPPKKKKQKKVKMVRDSFTMPENDYAKIAALKEKCLMAGVHVKKSELLRAGLAYLTKLSNSGLLKTIKQVEKIKTGRPAKHR